MFLLPVSYQIEFMPRDEIYLGTNGFFVYKDLSTCTSSYRKITDDKRLLIRHMTNYGKECVSKYGNYKNRKVRIIVSKPEIDKNLFKPDNSYSYIEDPVYVGYVERDAESLDIWLTYFVSTMEQIKRQNWLALSKGRNLNA